MALIRRSSMRIRIFNKLPKVLSLFFIQNRGYPFIRFGADILQLQIPFHPAGIDLPP